MTIMNMNNENIIDMKNLIIKDVKELNPEIIISGTDILRDYANKQFDNSKRFSLFEPDVDEKIEDVTFVSLNISNENKLKYLEIDKSTHLLLNVEKNASFDLIILMKENNNVLIVEAILEKDSFARITCISNKDSITKYYSNCDDNSRFEAVNFSLANIKTNSKIILKDNASCLIANSYYNTNKASQIKDLVIHQGRNSKSLIASKGYLINSKIDSRGLIRIEPSAFNAQGFQESSILLEGDSKAISVPDLEILNNEVKCSHGSTISRIKDEDLFYFESRGIIKNDARKMLIQGLLLSILPSKEIKEFATQFLNIGEQA